MSFVRKFQDVVSKAQEQASVQGGNLSRQMGTGSQQLTSNFTLEKECQRAAATLESFAANPQHPQSALNAIPREVLRRAKGLAIFTVIKAGFVWSARVGSGVVIARLTDGSWSAPSCIGTGGVGFGLQIGADLSEFVIVLNSEEAVKAFSQGGNLTIGGNLSASAGPIGTGAAVNSAIQHPSPMFTYSKSKGLYAGVSLEGTGLVERVETNAAFYGTRIPAADLLSGKVPPPEAASALYDIIEGAEGMDESSVPQQSYLPPPADKSALFDAGQPQQH